jgi:uncharacterized repeat protein (TIGR03837 family)
MRRIRADLFCRVIDNLGDIGVMWRLARQLSHEKKWSIRLWVDNTSALARLLPNLDIQCRVQDVEGISICHWSDNPSDPLLASAQPNEVVIAGFSCELPNTFVTKMCRPTPPIWFQLEYLSAEPWVRGFHGRSSPRQDGLAPIFIFPGFESGTGGLLRELGLIAQRDAWQSDIARQLEWLCALGVSLTPEQRQHTRLVSLFAYEDAPVDKLLSALRLTDQPTTVLVPGNITYDRLPKDFEPSDHIRWQAIPFLSQPEFDRLLWSMDLNIVRGEDSFVRAIWAKRPFIWHVYPQTEQTHQIKLNAWLARTSLPSQVQTALRLWVTRTKLDHITGDATPQLEHLISQTLKAPLWFDWQFASENLSQALAQTPDLASQLDELSTQRQSKHRLA